MSSTREYTLTQFDRDRVSQYREWLKTYFTEKFNYEASIYMQLNKVKEFIFNERSSLASNNASARYTTSDGVSLQREFDLVVKVERIWSVPHQ